MKILKGIGIVILGLLVLIAGIAFGARFADGPVAMLPGGTLTSGEWVEERDVDWTFAADIQEIELESGDRSRTTWILVHDGEAYVPASLSFPPGKSWHREALDDPAAVVRVEGRRYRRNLEKVDDPELEARLGELARGKYTAPPGGGGAWFFHLAPPE